MKLKIDFQTKFILAKKIVITKNYLQLFFVKKIKIIANEIGDKSFFDKIIFMRSIISLELIRKVNGSIWKKIIILKISD